MRRRVGGGLIVLLALVRAERAEACSPGCSVIELRPLASVPANTPALAFYSGRPYENGELISLEDGSGQRVDAALIDEPTNTGGPSDLVFVVPKTPLQPNQTYRATFDAPCLSRTQRHEQIITTTAPAPLPTEAGSVRAGKSHVDRIEVSAGGPCSQVESMAAVDLLFTPSPALVPFLPIARFTTIIEGQAWPWAVTRFGDTRAGYRDPLQILSRCSADANTQASDEGLPVGHYTGKLIVEVAGMEPLPAIPFAIDLECPKSGCDATGASNPLAGPWMLLLVVVGLALRQMARTPQGAGA